MARVVPSDIVKYLDNVLPVVATPERRKQRFSVNSKAQPGLIQSVAALLRELDETVLPQKPEDYVKFVAAREAIESTARTAETGLSVTLDKLAGFEAQNPIAIVREILGECRDDAIPASTTDMAFITDPIYREMLRRDLAAIEVFLNNRQWKAAMVIGGSLIEALLCFTLENRQKDALDALKTLRQRGDLPKNTSEDLNWWHLKEYVIVAHLIGLLQDRTKDMALLAGQYRNLIHPGKIVREQADCTKGTAFGVVGAVFLVIEDLNR